jgi:tRNA-dihydrouridine synthase A
MRAMNAASHRLCTAPMMDWSDRHCRYFFRQLTRRAMVYTEMITCGALLHGDVRRHLQFHPAEHPIALQLGGSDPAELAHCAQLAAQWGYDEVNLNCGCPSERVARGSFGACLMSEPQLVAECVSAMRAASGLKISVKHRLGIDRIEDYAFARRFVDTVARAGAGLFIVHARNAVLKGLSPKENREVPPLRYAEVYRLKQDFGGLTIVLNGGVQAWTEVHRHLDHVDGVMLGRAAYHDSYLLAQADRRLFDTIEPEPSREQVVDAMYRYACAQTHSGTPLRAIARHMLGLFHGHPGARLWRRALSDPAALACNDPQLLLRAAEAVLRPKAAATA